VVSVGNSKNEVNTISLRNFVCGKHFLFVDKNKFFHSLSGLWKINQKKDKSSSSFSQYKD